MDDGLITWMLRYNGLKHPEKVEMSQSYWFRFMHNLKLDLFPFLNMPYKQQLELPRVKPLKYQKKVLLIKKDARSELDAYEWSKLGYAQHNFWIDPRLDRIPRIQYQQVSPQEFIDAYESKDIPVVIRGAMDDWKAMTNWSIEVILLPLFIY